MKYIIAAVEGTRFDLAPQLECEHVKTYAYSTFRLIIATFGNYEKTYKETYDKVAAYVAKVNAEFKNNNYFKGAYRAEMLTPNEHGEYNATDNRVVSSWLILTPFPHRLCRKRELCGSDVHHGGYGDRLYSLSGR